MPVACTEYLIDNIPVIRQKYQSLTTLIQPANGKNPGLEIYIVNDVGLILQVGGTGNAFGLIKRQVNGFLLFADGFAIHQHNIAFLYPVSFQRFHAIDGYPQLFNILIRFPAGAET